MTTTEPTIEIDLRNDAGEVSVAGRADAFRPSAAGWTARMALLVATAAVVLLAPFYLHDRVVELAAAPIYAIIALSLNVLIGYTGTISLGHQAFVGIGAFTTAYVVGQHHQPFLLGIAVAAALGAVQALLLGGLALRISGLYFSLITLSYGVLAQESLFNIKSLTGGGAGATAPIPTPIRTYFYICLGFLALVLYADWRLMRSKGGRALLALRENPRVAQTFGIDVKLYTLVGFMVSGVFAGIGGALLAHRDEVVNSVGFDFRLALLFVLMTVVGGLRSRTGIVIGASLFALLKMLVQVVPGFERSLARWDLTLPVLVLLVGAALVYQGVRKGNRYALVGGGVLAVLAVLVLSPVTVPFLEDRLAEIPVLTPERASGVVGPVMLLVVLTRLPGGIGQLVRPIQRWVAGHRFDWASGRVKEVTITDVRA
ncbi:MAG: leucine/isoleucine/valine transporter permease subunit [Actinomycetia bacterium]|nr:leucine/isoleucine/valine transporter permease subunit [Actinomycetes bacterium]